MATTTNYGWTTPDDTALVKDGAAAIRTLGSSADTTVKNLNPETTLGDIAYRSSTSNVNTRLGIGSAGQVLTVASGIPSWSTPSSGGMTSIASGSLTSTSVDITSIPSTYNQLVLELKDFFTSGNGYAVYVRITGETTGYQGSYLRNVGGTNGTAVISTDNFTKFLTESLKNTDNNNYMVVNFPNYASSVRKLAQGYSSYVENSNAVGVSYMNAAINYTSAISSLTVTIEPSGQTFSGGTYVLWGIK